MESPGIEMQNLIPSRRSSCNASEASIPRLGTNQLQQSPSGGQYAPLHPRDPQTLLKPPKLLMVRAKLAVFFSSGLLDGLGLSSLPP